MFEEIDDRMTAMGALSLRRRFDLAHRVEATRLTQRLATVFARAGAEVLTFPNTLNSGDASCTVYIAENVS